MYMAPIVAPRPASRTSLLRHGAGLVVVLLAMSIALPWLAVNATVAGILLAGRMAGEALDYAGRVALGR